MNRRDTVFAFLALGVAPLAAFAQPADKLHRVGFLAGGGAPPDGAVPALLRQAMRDLGYVEGGTIAYTGRWADAKIERLPGLAAELVALNVDVIVIFGGPAAAAAKQATSTIPIVMAGSPRRRRGHRHGIQPWEAWRQRHGHERRRWPP